MVLCGYPGLGLQVHIAPTHFPHHLILSPLSTTGYTQYSSLICQQEDSQPLMSFLHKQLSPFFLFFATSLQLCFVKFSFLYFFFCYLVSLKIYRNWILIGQCNLVHCKLKLNNIKYCRLKLNCYVTYVSTDSSSLKMALLSNTILLLFKIFPNSLNAFAPSLPLLFSKSPKFKAVPWETVVKQC